MLKTPSPRDKKFLFRIQLALNKVIFKLLKIHIKLLTRITNKRIVNANIKALQQIYDES